jgi:superfamily I DNA/RNA helicase/RecB family exonuclease
MPVVTRPLLVRRPRLRRSRPHWDEAARRVLEHREGQLRVLGGPGTGKTTLLLESVVRRIREGTDPERLLVLVGSRRAATELRERITAELTEPAPESDGASPDGGNRRLSGAFGTVREPLVRTVHSYAFGLLRLHAGRAGDPPPRLLAGPEQDAVVRELLAGELAGDVPGSGWPDRLRPALGVPGFAAELRELLLRAAERGLGPYELAQLGARVDVPEWVAAGRFYLRYEQVNQLRGAVGSEAPQATAPALDAAELVAAALDVLAADPELLDQERDRVGHLLVDDAQDLDPQQMELVDLLGATARTFLLAGDPDQAVLGFRGADPTALRDADPSGRRTVVLTEDHRSAPALLTATSRLARNLPGAGAARHRVLAPPTPGGDERPAGSVVVQVFSSAAQEAGWVADRLRRAHLTDGVPWSEMAVVVRSTARSLPVLRRAMLAAGVPMAVPPDELPLSRQPAVLPFLMLLRAAASPEEIDADAAVSLLSSPLGAADPLRLRRLRRGLLRLHAAGATGGDQAVPPPERAAELGPPGERGHREPAADGPAERGTTGSPDGGSGERPGGGGSGERPGGGGSGERPGDGGSGERPGDGGIGERPRDGGSGAQPDGRTGDRPGDATSEQPDGGSDELLVDALRAGADGETDPLTALPSRDTAPLRRVARLLGLARQADLRGDSAEEVLWQVWQASGLANRWAAASALPGPAGAQADRDLDAVVALFDAAARYTDRLPGGGDIGGFVEYIADQRIPGDSLAPRAPKGEAVTVLTAHAARGREWRVVAVPSVQEGSWPDPRLRGTLLGVERLVDVLAGIGVDEPFPTTAGASTAGRTVLRDQQLSRVAPLLAEERRLFYVACTRAAERLLVCGVRGEDEQPSRFLDELDPDPADAEPDAPRPVSRPPRALVLAELVGELRRAVCAAEADSPPGRRDRAAEQLARLAAAGVRGAHPDDWYGLPPLSSDLPLRDPAEPVPVSPSDVEKVMKCPLSWVLERHGGDDGAVLPAVTGSLVHALVQATAAGTGEAEVDEALRRAWSAVDAGAPWFGRRELERVRRMLGAFRGWLGESRRTGLTEVAVEQGLALRLTGEDGEPDVTLRGRVDRLELDDAGQPVIVDVKTGKTVVSKQDAEAHPQLAVYQLAAALGAFRDVLGGPAEPGGARLLFLADPSGRAKERVQPALGADGVEQWREQVREVARETGAARFTARQNADCDRCGVRSSCPAHDDGRGVPEQ